MGAGIKRETDAKIKLDKRKYQFRFKTLFVAVLLAAVLVRIRSIIALELIIPTLLFLMLFEFLGKLGCRFFGCQLASVGGLAVKWFFGAIGAAIGVLFTNALIAPKSFYADVTEGLGLVALVTGLVCSTASSLLAIFVQKKKCRPPQ